jgi:hypothetical protein
MNLEEVFNKVDDVYNEQYEGSLYLTEKRNTQIKSEIEDYANKRVLEELEDIVDDCIHIIREPMLQGLLKRIKELKEN